MDSMNGSTLSVPLEAGWKEEVRALSWGAFGVTGSRVHHTDTIRRDSLQQGKHIVDAISLLIAVFVGCLHVSLCSPSSVYRFQWP